MRTTAPAASANRTELARSAGLMRRLRILAATTSTGRPCVRTKTIGERQGIEKAGTGPGEIDGTGIGQFEMMGKQRRRRRQQMIGCRGGKQRQRDIGTIDARIADRHLPCACRKCRQRIARPSPVAAPDAGPAFDPSRLKAEPRLDLGIFDTAPRHAMAKTGKAGGTRAPHRRPAVNQSAASSIAS